MTPLERVNRLREETATRVTPGPWSRSSQYGRVDVFRHPYEPGDDVVAEQVDAYDAAHIARWDPVAAGKVLDLLQSVFAYHTNLRGECLADGTKWPCIEHSSSLAVLDQLDGGSAVPATQPDHDPRKIHPLTSSCTEDCWNKVDHP